MIFELAIAGLGGILAGYSFRVARQDARMDYWLQFGGVLIALLLLAEMTTLESIAYLKAYNDAVITISSQYACVKRSEVTSYVYNANGQMIPLVFDKAGQDGNNTTIMPIDILTPPIQQEGKNAPFR